MTSGWTRSAGEVPADRAPWRPAPNCSNRAWLICERPAFWRQRNRTVDIDGSDALLAKLSSARQELLLFALSSLMVAEERITTKFSGLVGAHGTEEEATFLATQQVDEARHMQFYARFQDEVIAHPDVISAHVRRAREHVSDAFRELFDVALVNAHE